MDPPAALMRESATDTIMPSFAPSAEPSHTRMDVSLPLFFPQSGHSRLCDSLDALREGFGLQVVSWGTGDPTLIADEARQRWEEVRGDLTRDWKKRHREAVKSRRRRGGPGDDAS